MKTCTRCKQPKRRSEFAKNVTRHDGLQSACKTCTRAYSKRHYENNKEYYINKASHDYSLIYYRNLKSNLVCVDCDKQYPDEPYLFEFDHVRGGKTKTVSQLSRISKKKLQDEIKLCEVVCVLCHRRRTAKRAGWYPHVA